MKVLQITVMLLEVRFQTLFEILLKNRTVNVRVVLEVHFRHRMVRMLFCFVDRPLAMEDHPSRQRLHKGSHFNYPNIKVRGPPFPPSDFVFCCHKQKLFFLL